MIAVTRLAEAILQALIMIKSSIRLVDFAATALNEVDILSAHTLPNLHAGLLVAEFLSYYLTEFQAQALSNLLG